MTDSPSLPNSARPPLDPRDGRFTNEWYGYFRGLARQEGLTAAQSALLNNIVRRLAALEGSGDADADIVGVASVLISGSLLGGLVQVSLDGDEAAPGSSSYYGTDKLGAKGFHPIPDDTVPYIIPDGETYTVRENKQAPFTIPIDIGVGSGLIVEGILVEVD